MSKTHKNNPPAASSVIADLLVKEGLITQEQHDYARRVRAKMRTSMPLIDVMQELGYVTKEDVTATLRKNTLSLRIGDFLVELGYLREADLLTALSLQKSSEEGKMLGDIIVEMGYIDERKFNEVLSYQLGFPLIDLEFRKLDRRLFAKASYETCRQHLFAPVSAEDGVVTVAFADPLDEKTREVAMRIFGDNIQPGISSKRAVLTAIASAEKGGNAEETPTDDSSVVGIINKLLNEAITNNASDIHIEPLKDRLRVRFRLDGVLMPHLELPLELAPQLSSRLKVMAQADIAEKRRHQDGRILFESRVHGFNLDLRVSFFITIFGEKIVLRLLNKKEAILDVQLIGMAPRMLSRYIEDALDTPSGVIIITGPTGSGKTSTLYSCVSYLNKLDTSIITAEDPVEYVIDGISQCSINTKIGVTFEETLRHIVRQDPDVIVLGEIRDNFSAETAIQAALTGHKVLTTFHTEDSIGGLLRLMNMHIETFLISSTVVSVVAQRLLRLVCNSCGEPYTPTPQEFKRLGFAPKELAGANFRMGRGCKDCRFTGYKGRVAVFELLILNEPVKQAILNNKASAEIRRISMETSGMVTLFEDGLVKAARGLVSIPEVIRDLPRIAPPRPLSELNRILGTQP
ncbi:GspE/PulE family protein [Geomesophilobacter sediminis]|uniref:Flp pilus assembly complex ATPase component TadA n=1 Tax=Geomesophilobacter sediminis TaxID=2798584 RepID=A0A8J7M2K7_9BACT|nr:ATPase, T2SS/T4P/T4SS family [Geomesophilobacter sediminis]MBJ6727575.1 Flp pilus assembly complex ATPase component TadA [Geomesophilobacter sediminis]